MCLLRRALLPSNDIRSAPTSSRKEHATRSPSRRERQVARVLGRGDRLNPAVVAADGERHIRLRMSGQGDGFATYSFGLAFSTRATGRPFSNSTLTAKS